MADPMIRLNALSKTFPGSERPAVDLHHPELADWDVEGYLASLDSGKKPAGAGHALTDAGSTTKGETS